MYFILFLYYAKLFDKFVIDFDCLYVGLLITYSLFTVRSRAEMKLFFLHNQHLQIRWKMTDMINKGYRYTYNQRDDRTSKLFTFGVSEECKVVKSTTSFRGIRLISQK